MLQQIEVRKINEEKLLFTCTYKPGMWFRLKGLLGRKELLEGEGIYLKPCNAIHMFFMKFPIDAIFLDAQNTIVHLEKEMQPWRISSFIPAARSVLEVSSGSASKCELKVGDELQLRLFDKTWKVLFWYGTRRDKNDCNSSRKEEF